MICWVIHTFIANPKHIQSCRSISRFFFPGTIPWLSMWLWLPSPLGRDAKFRVQMGPPQQWRLQNTSQRWCWVCWCCGGPSTESTYQLRAQEPWCTFYVLFLLLGIEQHLKSQDSICVSFASYLNISWACHVEKAKMKKLVPGYSLQSSEIGDVNQNSILVLRWNQRLHLRLCPNIHWIQVGGFNPSGKYESQLGWLATQY